MAGKLAAALAALLLLAAPAIAEEPGPRFPQCKPPASDITMNEVVARLQCRLEVLGDDRVREANSATMAKADLELARAELVKLRGEVTAAQAELQAAKGKKR